MCHKFKYHMVFFFVLIFSVSVFGQREYSSIGDLYVDYHYHKTISEGEQIILVGYFTTPEESLLVENYWDFFAEQPIHPDSFVICLGNLPPEMLSYYRISILGTLGSRLMDFPYTGKDKHLTVDIISYETLESSPSPPIDLDFRASIELDPTAGQPDICCNFTVIISGGVNHANNHTRYWNNISDKYAAYRNSGHYQEANIYVFYFKGLTKDEAKIPQSRIAAATEANIQAALNAIAAEIEGCVASGKNPTLRLHVTNHGARSDKGICMLGEERITPTELKTMIQPLIDAGLKDFAAEFAQCYGGAHVDMLKTLNAPNCNIHLCSGAAANEVAWATYEFTVFQKFFIDALAAGMCWDDAAAWAAEQDSIYWDKKVSYQKEHPQLYSDVKDPNWRGPFLPVEFVGFSAELLSSGGILLKWTTASETENYGFEILSSQHERDFQNRGFIPGAGTSTNEQHYSFIDKPDESGDITYIIHQIDYDGTETVYGPFQVIRNNPASFTVYSNFPNPFNLNTVITFSLPVQMQVKAEIYNIFGQRVKTLVNESMKAGSHRIIWNGTDENLQTVSSGNYLLKIQADDQVKNLKLTVIK